MSINIPQIAAKLRIQSCDLFNDDGILIDDEIDTIGLGHAIMEYIYNSNDSAYNYNKLSVLHTELIALCKQYNIVTDICTNPNKINEYIEIIKKHVIDKINEMSKYNPWKLDHMCIYRKLHKELLILYNKYNITYDTQNQLDKHFEFINQMLIEKSACYYNSIQAIINPKQECRPPFLEPLTPILSPKQYPESETITSESPIISEKYAFEIGIVPFDESILKPLIQKSTTNIMTCPHCEKLVYINAST